MTSRRLLLLTALPLASAALVLAVALHAPLSHADDDDHIRARLLRERGEIMSLEQIAERARAVRAGKLIDIELERKHDAWRYEVELLDPQGRVWEIDLDARTGEVLKLEQDD
jgi:uncharacterized membrane protein YkoI